MATVAYPSLELTAAKATLVDLARGISEFSLEAVGNSVMAIWLRGESGNIWLIAVDQRDVRPKFEVFTIGIATMEELRARWGAWKAPVVPDGLPEGLRQMMITRPPEPVAPTEFRPWPLKKAKVNVLRRAEFVIEDVGLLDTFGEHPNAQSADRPGHVPDEASVSCEVAVGLLFTGDAGRRLLIGVDWTPFKIVFTQDSAAIDAYLAPCEQVELSTYLQRIRPA